MMPLSLTHRSARAATPLILLDEGTFASWEKKQSAFVRGWIKTQGFKPKAGKSLIIPDKEGGIKLVLACVSDPVSLWDLAALPPLLPKGTYALEGAPDEATEEKLALGWILGGYKFDKYKKGEEPKAHLALPKTVDLKRVIRIAQAVAMARDIITTPAQDMGPADLAKQVKETAQLFGGKVTEIVGADLLKKHYPAIHAVGRASSPERAPRLIDLSWGNPKHPRLTLVGKGVCFDTGGLDLKTSGGMYLMRKDKGGAAVALGVARLVMESGLPVRLRLLIPAVENAVSGDAFRPSDVLTMRSGLTVEVGNTDAEGRLILADALAEAASEDPDLLIDFSTLCGATRSALGTQIGALFSNDPVVASALMQACAEQEDALCQFPLHKAYEPVLDSPFADVNSSPSIPYAQPILAALFLQRFVAKAKSWVHLDFMAWMTGSKPGRAEGGEASSLRAVFAMLEKRYSSP